MINTLQETLKECWTEVEAADSNSSSQVLHGIKYLCETDLTFYQLVPEMLLHSQYSRTNIVPKMLESLEVGGCPFQSLLWFTHDLMQDYFCQRD